MTPFHENTPRTQAELDYNEVLMHILQSPVFDKFGLSIQGGEDNGCRWLRIGFAPKDGSLDLKEKDDREPPRPH